MLPELDTYKSPLFIFNNDCAVELLNSNNAVGLVVPIPTFPSESIRTLSELPPVAKTSSP
jgi:hypothetical protein